MNSILSRKMEEKKKKVRKKSMDDGDLREITEEILDHGVEELVHEEKHLEKAIGDKKEEWAVKNLLRRARRLEEHEDYRKAIEYYLKFLEKYLILVKARKKYRLKDYYKAGDYYTKIAELYKKIHHIRAGERLKDMKKASEYYEKAAKIYLDGQEHSKANKSFLRSAEIFHELDLYELCANQYISIAEIYRIKGDKLLVSGFYEKAAQEYLEGDMKEKSIEMILEAAKMKDEINDKEGVSEDYAKVADIYRSMRKHNKAIKYYAKSVEILYGIEKFIKLREIYDGIAEDYESLQKYDDAIYYHLSSGYLNKDKDKYASSNAFEGAGRCYSLLGDYKNAIKYYTISADLRIDLAKYLDTALAFKAVADCYRAIGDVESAAEYYFRYAEYGLMDKKGLSSIEGFKIASDIYLKLAESLPHIDEEKMKTVIKLYKKLAKSYSGLKDYKKAGDSFFIAADIENDLDMEKQTQTYHDAITEYEKIDDLWAVGKSYARIGEYKDSAIAYIQYAKEMLKKDDIFSTGEGYRKAGDNMNLMDESKDASKNYNKALKYYLLYLQKTEKTKLIEEEKASQGNTLKHIGECYIGMGNLKVASDYLTKALEYFKKKEMLREITYINAFLDAIEAKIVMRSGDYAKTHDLLVSSINEFDKLLKDKEYDREYVELFRKNKKEVEELLDAIEKKPEVSLIIDRTSNTFKALPVIINIHIKNKSPITVYNISFLPHLPDEINIFMEPKPIDKIEPGGEVRTAIELVSDITGKYKLKPIEIIYEDDLGVKYVKAPNIVTLHVIERPSEDYKDYNLAISTYLEYAENHLYNKNFYHAAEGYRGVAETYGKFEETEKRNGFYWKAIKAYQQFIGEMEGKKEQNLAEQKRLSDTYRCLGECYEVLDNLKKSEKYFTNAIKSYNKVKEATEKFYDKTALENKILALDAILSKVRGKIAMSQGFYAKATKLLNKSEGELNKSIRNGGWLSDYEDYLDKNMREIRVLKKEIETKPPINVRIEYPQKIFENREFNVTVEITNKGEDPINTIRFLNRVSEEDFQIIKLPEKIPVLNSEESVNTSIILLPKKTGDFEFKVFDISYKNKEGINFISGSEYLSLQSVQPELKKEGGPPEKKPEVSLIIDRTSYTLKGVPVILNMEVKNQSRRIPLHDVSFLPHLPDEINIFMEPKPIDKIEPGGVVRTAIELVSDTPQEYKLTPVEVIYQDNAGKKYVKASNLVTLNVMDRPSIDYKDYNIAVSTYREYAKNQIKNRNFYHAADGYRGVAETYGRFGETEKRNEFYLKAIKAYQQFIEGVEGKEDISLAEQKRSSETYRYLGECYEILNNLKKSREYLTKSISSYEKTMEVVSSSKDILLLENQTLAIKALLSKVRAKIAIGQGFYAKAIKMLNQSEKDFTKAIQRGGWSLEYEDYLDKNMREISVLKKEIESKPLIDVEIRYPPKITQNKEFTVKLKVKNSSNQQLMNLGFLSKAPKEFEIKQTPGRIPTLKPNESEEKIFTLIPREDGEFEFKLFDVSYKDGKGNNFSIGSEYVLLTVSPAEDEEKPQGEEQLGIEMILDTELRGIVGEPLTLKVELTNLGNQPIKDIVFLIHLPEEFRVESAFESISKLEPGNSVDCAVTIQPLKVGEYNTTPIQLVYKDMKGNNFVKKSDIVSIKVEKSHLKTKKEESRMEELATEKSKVERMMSLAKSKYHNREIDEETYRTMLGEYEKKIIEFDVELERSSPDSGEETEKKTETVKKRQEEGLTIGLNYPSDVKINKPFTIKITIENNTGSDLYDVKLWETVTGELEITKAPGGVKLLESGETVNLELEFTPKIAGSVGCSLFKLSYKEESGVERIMDTKRVFIKIR